MGEWYNPDMVYRGLRPDELDQVEGESFSGKEVRLRFEVDHGFAGLGNVIMALDNAEAGYVFRTNYSPRLLDPSNPDNPLRESYTVKACNLTGILIRSEDLQESFERTFVRRRR